MLITDVVKLFKDEKESVVFNIFDNQNFKLLRSYYKDTHDIFTLYKDLKIDSFTVNYNDNEYTVNIIIDIVESVAYHTEYYSARDNQLKTIDLSFTMINNINEIYEECLSDNDFDTVVKNIFAHNS